MATPCGVYVDPKHGGCLRVVRAPRAGDPPWAAAARWVIEGAYGDDEALPAGTPWLAAAEPVAEGAAAAAGGAARFLRVHFRGKRVRHATTYAALWCPAVREIHWEDGNVWQKLYFSSTPA